MDKLNGGCRREMRSHSLKGTYGGRQHRASEPHGVALHVMGDDLHLHGLRLQHSEPGLGHGSDGCSNPSQVTGCCSFWASPPSSLTPWSSGGGGTNRMHSAGPPSLALGKAGRQDHCRAFSHTESLTTSKNSQATEVYFPPK